MYRAITVDDDRWALADMRQSFDFPAFGYALEGEYASAEAALEAVFRSPPDLIVTDICMENKSGLDLIRTCNQYHIGSVFVVVSGHDSFAYAREAVNERAFYYMLKPISDREAQDVMRRVRSHMDANPQHFPIERGGMDTFERVLLYVQLHYNKPMTLEEVAAAHFINKNYLSQLFTQRVGKTFSQFRNDLRIQEAKKLILEGKLNLSDIAMQVGYENANYFSRVFKNKTRMTPQEFKRQLLRTCLAASTD